MPSPNLFQELDDCDSCPNLIHTRGENEAIIQQHLQTVHPGVNATAFVVAKRHGEERKGLQHWYDRAKDYLDRDFHTRFIREFDKLSWELVVFKHLTESGIAINTSQSAGPDFDTEIGYIECICLGQGHGDNAIPIPKAAVIDEDGVLHGEIEFQPVPLNHMKLRVGSGFYDKQQVYKRYVQRGYIDPGKPRIIALNWYSDGAAALHGRGHMEHDPAIQTIFGSGNRQITIDTTNGEVTDSSLAHEPIISKANGQVIDVGFFARQIDDDTERIDGVILSNEWPGSLRLEHARVINNPMSQVNLDLKRLTTCGGFRATKNSKTGMIHLTSL